MKGIAGAAGPPGPPGPTVVGRPSIIAVSIPASIAATNFVRIHHQSVVNSLISLTNLLTRKPVMHVALRCSRTMPTNSKFQQIFPLSVNPST